MAYVDVSALAGISLLAGIDPVTREMFLSLATVDTSINPIDIYKEMRICRRLDEDLRGFEVFLAAFGNVPKGPGKATERFVQQLLGTRFVPYDADQELTVTGTVITDDGQEGVACFDRTGLTATTVVDINYVPPQVEVITVTTGSGLSTEQAAQLQKLYNFKGLNPSAPVSRGGDQVTSETLTTDGEVLTITPTTISSS